MTNQEIARKFFEMAAFTEMEGVPFRPQAYERAALSIQTLDRNAEEILREDGIKGLMQIPGIGKGMAEHIQEISKTGTFKEYEKFREKTPVNVLELKRIQGLGPKTIKSLYQKLKITNAQELKAAAEQGELRKLPYFGVRLEQKVLNGLKFLDTTGPRRTFGSVIQFARKLEQSIAKFPETRSVAIAGSLRRRTETVGDLDFVIASDQADKVFERLIEQVDHVYEREQSTLKARLRNLMDADFLIVPEISFGAALCFYTGSKDHTNALREIAGRKGWKFEQFGIFDGQKQMPFPNEKELYKAFGLQFVPPELRENQGELAAAARKHLPALIEYGELKGDLQVQTDWTDGDHSIEEMAEAAEKLGLEYIAITDHTKGLPMTRGSDESRLREQMKAIDAINKKLKAQKKKFRILKGAEVNIMKDGSLDIEDEVLAELDVVGAAVHHHFRLSREEQTARLLRVLNNPNVDIIFHLTARKVIKRDPIDLDVDAVIEAALSTGTVVEIDASPDRLDIKDEYIRKCVEAGVKMCIDSDAHATGEFRYLEYGIGIARRGWATRTDIINTLPVDGFLASLKDRAKGR